MINSILHWLRSHKVIATIIAVAYSIVVTMSHDLVQAPALAFQKVIGMVVWHYSLLAIIAVGVISVLLTIIRSNDIKTALIDNRLPIGVLVGLTALVSSLLMVNSVEHIHLLQYMILVFLLIPVFENSLVAMLVAMLVGAFDEGYQFWVLHSWQGYLDFNDIILNSLGAAWGVALFEVFYTRTGDDIPSLGEQPLRNTAIAWCVFFALIVTLFYTGVLGSFENEGALILSRYPEPDPNGMAVRWIDTEWGNHWYHITPREGLFIVFLLPLTVFRSTSPKD